MSKVEQMHKCFKPCECVEIPEHLDELNKWTGESIWNAIYTIQLGELVEHGVFDWNDKSVNWESAAYNPEQYERVCAYFIERYFYREISMEPYAQWAKALKRKLVFELMPKYRPLYEMAENGIDPLQIEDEYYKRRTIGSDYPETLLSENADYVSDGEDEEYERVRDGDTVDRYLDFAERFKGIDELLLDELECLFVGLYTMNVNVY